MKRNNYQITQLNQIIVTVIYQKDIVLLRDGQMLVSTIEYISWVIGLIGIAVIVYGAIVSTFKFVKIESKRLKGKISLKDTDILRLTLGTYLLLGLEFLIAADIIRTILKPSLHEVAILGAIVAIRTVINYFLDIEIEEVQQHQQDNAKIKV